MPLRDYQTRALSQLAGMYRGGCRSACLVSPTGSGKTTMGATMVERAAGRVLWVAHRAELVEQAAARLASSLGPASVGVVMPGRPGRPLARVQVGTVQTLLARDGAPPASLVVLDECFPAGTMVDGRTIESIKVGQTVASINHATNSVVRGVVVRTFRTRPTDLVTVHVDGRRVTCTGSHPFFIVGKGYIHAKDIEPGDVCCVLSGNGQRPDDIARPALVRRARVDRVEVHEPGSDGKFGGLCPDGYVYNLEVKGHHNYFAEGVLAHNCHHYVAESWKDLLHRYPEAYTLGLTATPERSDGRPLGDIFSGLVVAASYSELLAAGHLVPCRVYQPPEQLGARHIAQDPVAAYERFTPGELGFCFSPTVDVAHQHADAFTAAGYRAEVISDRTSKRDRARHLADFAAGRVRVLCNVYALTEGVDVPAASVAILARGCGHVGMYLQIVGRVLRPYPGKDTATLLDLSGASLAHGMPTSDREFSLDGEGIRRADGVEPVRVCLRCGATYEGGLTCPACDYRAESKADKIKLTIVNAELREVYAGPATPPVAKRDELTRLVAVMRERGYSAGWVVREYRRLFGSAPALVGVLADAELRAEYERYREQAAERGHRPGAAKMKFKEVFGIWPR